MHFEGLFVRMKIFMNVNTQLIRFSHTLECDTAIRAKRKTAVAILVLQFSNFNFHMNFSCELSVYAPPSESFRTKHSSGNITRPMFWSIYLFFVWADYLDILQYLTTIY